MTKCNPGVSSKLSGEGMVVGGEQQAAVHLAADVLQHSMGNGIAIKGAGTSPQLIQDHQAVWRCMLQQSKWTSEQHLPTAETPGVHAAFGMCEEDTVGDAQRNPVVVQQPQLTCFTWGRQSTHQSSHYSN